MRTAKGLGLATTLLLVLAVVWSACNGGNNGNLGGSEGEVITLTDGTVPSIVVGQETRPGSDLASVLGSGGEPLAMARQPVSYLKEVIPPCVPLEGSDLDPCSPILLSVTNSETLATAATTMLYSLPSFNDVFLGILDFLSYPNLVPHVVIRGVAKPDTTRCAKYPAKLFSYELSSELYSYASRDEHLYVDTYFYHCFLDFKINEYIVGKGPSELTISVNTGIIFPRDEPYLDESFYKSRYQKAEDHEGKEMILFLGSSRTAIVEAWHIIDRWRAKWFIQRDGDEVRAVASDIYWIVEGYNDHLLSQMDMPLSELIPQIKDAAEERTAITGGRIGAHSNLPLLVTDANKLQDYYGAVGAVYEGDGATVLPPPAPGGDEPEQPPTQVGEGQPTVASAPVPGDETSPTTTDDAAPLASSTTSPPSVDTTAPSTSTTLLQTEVSEPTTTTTTTQPQIQDQDTVTTTTSPPPSTGATQPTDAPQPQTEDTTPATTTTTSAPPVDDTTTQLQAEDGSSSTTVASVPPVDDSGAAATTAPLGDGGLPADEGGENGLLDDESAGG